MMMARAIVGAWVAGLWGLSASASAVAADPAAISMRDKGASTYYVKVDVPAVGTRDFLVDTGSSYTAINQQTLETLQAADQAQFRRTLSGIMADGSRKLVAVYRLSSLTLGNGCVLRDVEVAVLPGDTRHILGLSALRRAAPFVFSTDPPQLRLNGCQQRAAAASRPAAGSGGSAGP